GVEVVNSAKSDEVMLRRPFEVGLYFLIATSFPSYFSSIRLPAYSAGKISISFEASVNVTTALRRFLVKPWYLPIRFALGLTLMMLTFFTFTSKAASTACLTNVLLARVSTSNVYFFSSIAIIDFSVITGRLITSKNSIMQAPPQFE